MSTTTEGRLYRDPIGPVTDVTKWRLHCERGRQAWEYDELDKSGRTQNFIEKHALGMDTVCVPVLCVCVARCRVVYMCYVGW